MSLGIYKIIFHENVSVDQNGVLGIDNAVFNTKPSLIRIVDILGRETPVKKKYILR